MKRTDKTSLFEQFQGVDLERLADCFVAIRKAGTAKGQSRKFVNAALVKDIVIFLYMILKFDLYILSMTFVGFIFTIELLITIYYYYPYRYRNLNHFKRPSFWVYFINSCISNKIRKRL